MNQLTDLPPELTEVVSVPAAFTQVGVSRPHEAAHAARGSGRALHRRPAGTGGHAARGAGPVAAGAWRARGHRPGPHPRAARRGGRVHRRATIPGANDCGRLVHDDPILAGEPVPRCATWASRCSWWWPARETRHAAPRPTRAHTSSRPKALPPVLEPLEAHAAGQYVVPPMHLLRGDAKLAIAQAPHRLKLSFDLGGQEQFYLEGQISLCRAGGRRRHEGVVQHPAPQRDAGTWWRMRWAARRTPCRWNAGAWAAASAARNRRAGCSPASRAVAARCCSGKPVKLRVDRDDDFMVTGRRHGFHHRHRGGPRRQRPHPGRRGHDGLATPGHSADLSGPVMTRALCHFDNAYWLPHVWPLHGYSREDEHAEQHRLPRLRRPAGRVCHRARHGRAWRAT